MNVIDAAYRIASEYPGGAEALAGRMKITPAVFRSKLNPNVATHHLTLLEAARMQVMTGRADILHAMADELGFVVLPIPTVADVDVSLAIAETCGRFGEYLADIHRSLADSRVTQNEAKRLEADLTTMIATAGRLQSMLSAMSQRRLKTA